MDNKYIIATFENGYCGCDEMKYLIFPKNCTKNEIEDYLSIELENYADSYEYLVDEENLDDYWSNCSYDYFEVFDGDKELEENFEKFCEV